VQELAAAKGCMPAQCALAWVRAQEDIVAIPGTRHLEESVAAVDVELSRDELARIDSTLPPAAGDRYHTAGMAVVER
jgi:aryl-alcohol dehydrogenase-like predicted oxidoreductase